MAISELDIDGVYDDGEEGRPLSKFVVTNWTDEDLHTKWLGQDTVLKAGDIRECGHAEALHFTKTLVDREIFKDAAKAEDPKDREKREMNILSPLFRKPYEAKTIQKINPGEESPVVKKIREEVERKVRADLGAEAAAGVTHSGTTPPKEFEE